MKKPSQNVPPELARLAQSLVMSRPNLNVLRKDTDYPSVTVALEAHLQDLDKRNELILPELRKDNETIAVYSDYGGEHAGAKYRTFSFLVCAYDTLGMFFEKMADIREAHKLDDKEISFKDFRYGPVSRSMDDYLTALDTFVPGLLLTVIEEKCDKSILGGNKKGVQSFLAKHLKANSLGDWKFEIAEKLFAIIHIVSYLVALLSANNQKIFWMTDNDAIAEDRKFQWTLDLLSRGLSHYSDNKFAIVGGATPFEPRESKYLDLLSAADIVAGSVEHYFTKRKNNDDDVKEEANKVLEWLAHDGIGLKKLMILFKKNGDRMVSSHISFELKQEDPDAIHVPVVVSK